MTTEPVAEVIAKDMNHMNIPMGIMYLNHRNELAMREILPRRMFYGTTQWYDGPQWYLEAHDIEKDAMRTFAMARIQRMGNPVYSDGMKMPQ